MRLEKSVKKALNIRKKTQPQKKPPNRTDLTYVSVVCSNQVLAPHPAFLFMKLSASRRLFNAATTSKTAVNIDYEELKQK